MSVDHTLRLFLMLRSLMILGTTIAKDLSHTAGALQFGSRLC